MSSPNIVVRALRALRRPPRAVTGLVWGGAVCALLCLADHEAGGVRVAAYGQARSYQVASLAAGRIGSLAAEVQQDVQAGQVLATLDDQATALALRAATAELARLEAERRRAAAAVRSAAEERAAAHRAELRRFTMDYDHARVELLNAQSALAEDERRLQRMDVELAQLGERGGGTAASERMQEKRLQREMIAARVQGHRGLVTEHRLLFEKAKQRAEEFAESSLPAADGGLELAPHEEAIAAQQARIETLRQAQRELVLRAPIAGRVAAILRRPGEVVQAGEPVLTVIEREPSTVVAHLPEEYLGWVAPGTIAVLERQGSPAAEFDAVVVHTGAEIERLPQRAEGASPVPRWGFPVHLACPAGQGIVPGEQLAVVFRPPAMAPAAPGD
jgi:multidrug resistance efflux pump